MATVRVRRDDYEDGVLPHVCVATGAPAEVLVDHRSHRGLGAWGLLLLVFGPAGIVAWIVIDRVLRREAHGLLPASRAAVEASRAARQRWDVAVRAGLLAAAAGGVVAAVAEGPLATAGAVLLVAGLVVASVAWFAPVGLQPKGMPDRDGRWIELSGVSPELARAYRAQDEARAEARRSARRAGARAGVDPRVPESAGG
jgi:hypothetical protein